MSGPLNFNLFSVASSLKQGAGANKQNALHREKMALYAKEYLIFQSQCLQFFQAIFFLMAQALLNYQGRK